ncbi:hypothetical protein D5047_02765 [Verminephrobacter eiseniae]|nr:hypothetical protein [Verminephrobacter eiseniae]
MGDGLEPALSRAGTRGVSDVHGFGLVPCARERAQAVAAIAADPGFGGIDVLRAEGDGAEDARHERTGDAAVVRDGRLQCAGKVLSRHKRPLHPGTVKQRRAVGVRQCAIWRNVADLAESLSVHRRVPWA